LRLHIGAAVALFLAFAAPGCGTGGLPEDENASLGKELFTSAEARCGACHTLADAGARGTIGPNLDNAFAGPREEGFEDSTIAAIVLDQIRFPTEGSAMPADLVTGEEAEAVATYVGSVAGKEVEGAPAGGGTGEQLFTSLGCQGCHSLTGEKGTGPPLNGLTGKSNAELIQSIRDPDAKIAQGYQPGVMSAVIKKNQVSEAEARKLVQFIKTKK
jgi:mono/diheme cytochrome c family protein